MKPWDELLREFWSEPPPKRRLTMREVDDITAYCLDMFDEFARDSARRINDDIESMNETA